MVIAPQKIHKPRDDLRVSVTTVGARSTSEVGRYEVRKFKLMLLPAALTAIQLITAASAQGFLRTR